MNDESRFISLMSDYGFKVAFADESDTLFLRKALQALIQSDVPIKHVKFVKNEHTGLTKDARGGLYDLICEDERGRTFIVEMQLGYYKHFMQRTKFYAFQKFNTLIKRGKYYFKGIPPIYCIGFVAKSIFPKSKEYYHHGTLKNQKGEEMDYQMTHIIVEISKFDKQVHEIQSHLDKIIYTMKNYESIRKSNQLPEILNEDWIVQTLKKLDKSQMTPDQRMHFEMTMAHNASIIHQEEEEKERIRKEAKEKAEKETAEKVQKEMAKKFKDLGTEMHIIIEATGLSEEEIEAL